MRRIFIVETVIPEILKSKIKLKCLGGSTRRSSTEPYGNYLYSLVRVKSLLLLELTWSLLLSAVPSLVCIPRLLLLSLQSVTKPYRSGCLQNPVPWRAVLESRGQK